MLISMPPGLVVDLWGVLEGMLAQAPLTAAAVIALYLLLARELRGLERRTGALEARVGALESRIDRLEGRVDGIEGLLGALREQVGEIGRRADSLERRMDSLERQLGAVREKLEELGRRVDGIDRKVGEMGRAYHAFNTTLLQVMALKGVLTETEMRALAGLLSAAPHAPSRYYTEEVRRRLIEVLKAVEEGKYGVAELKELERIAGLIYAEWRESGREDLLDYHTRLTMLIAMMRGRLAAQGRLPLEELWR
jgi:chromosome segregation ATPase